MDWLVELTRYLIDGGPVMIPIGIGSVVALAAFLERMVALRRERVVPRVLTQRALEMLRQGQHSACADLVGRHPAAVARMLEVAVQTRGRPRAFLKERLEEVGRREAAELERVIPIVGLVASISPLLGLLGTVGGMIVTFAVIQDEGMGDMARLAGGISQALITTFAGLAVAIPAVLANRYLLSRVDNLLVELEEAAVTALDLLCSEAGVLPPSSGEGGAAPSSADAAESA